MGERGLLVAVLWSQKTSYGHVSHPWLIREDRLCSGGTTGVQVGRFQLTPSLTGASYRAAAGGKVVSFHYLLGSRAVVYLC